MSDPSKHPSKHHPFGPFTQPVPQPRAAPPAQPPARGPGVPPAAPQVGRAPHDGAFFLNRVYGHPPPLPSVLTAYAPVPSAPPVQVAPAPVPVRHVHFEQPRVSPVPLNQVQLQQIVPESMFRTPTSSANTTPATSPAAMRYAPLPEPPKIVLGGRQPPGMPSNPHSNLRLNSNHMIACRGRVYFNAERLYHSRKFGESPTTPDMERLIDLVAGSADPQAEAEKWRPYWRRNWEYVKDDVMRDLTGHKMAQYREIEAELVATGNADIIDAEDPANTLGRALMNHRASVSPRR
ncbi:hypothetical protein CALCODRAFT_480467 [Calocera cornea HHB12733]|uniref:NADAR domain-containing protein n=1 Tax=Calocera cornea HHB12733 TaxID=1353952 RepID=A0A165INX2_9BASI|nr:hypothetical protein CALCODRAFT_480467 [Calocera cornea HHB12733]